MLVGVSELGDTVARYGGEEFAVIAEAPDLPHALAMADMICHSISALAIPHDRSPFRVLTASVGVALIIPCEDDQPVDLMKLADAALYRAKQQGRNRVEVADAEMVT